MITILHIIATSTSTPISPGQLPTPAADTNAIQTILQIAFGILGALSLLMIATGGLRYITAAGNPEKTSKARNSIVYAVIGLVVAISYEAIISFVVNRL